MFVELCRGDATVIDDAFSLTTNLQLSVKIFLRRPWKGTLTGEQDPLSSH